MDVSNDVHEQMLYNSDDEVAAHLRAAYDVVDRRSCAPNLNTSDEICPCASSIFRNHPTLRELFTVTLNVEFLLARGERKPLADIRQRHMQWYRTVQIAMKGLECHMDRTQELLCYWVRGIVSYELRAMDEAMSREHISSSVALALSHAAELCAALRCRLPRLYAFFFPVALGAKEPDDDDDAPHLFPLPKAAREAVAEALHEPRAALLLQRVLSAALHRQREGLRRSGATSIRPPCDVLDLIRASAGVDAHVQETERLIHLVLRSVVDGCQRFFPRKGLRALLDPAKPDTARVNFLAHEWPAHCRAELHVTALHDVKPAWVMAVLAAAALLWDPNEPTASAQNSDNNNSSNSSGSESRSGCEAWSLCVDVPRCFLAQLLRMTLRAPFAALFDLDAADDGPEQRNAMESIAALARGMSVVDLPPRLALRNWVSIGVGPPLPASVPQDFGCAAMVGVCSELLDRHVRRAVTHILSEEEDSWQASEAAQWLQLLRYLLRTERAFTNALGDYSLRAHLFDHARGAPRFYSAVAASFSGQPLSRDVDALIDALLNAVHVYLLNGGSSAASLDPPLGILRSEADMHTALRLARCVASTDKFDGLYKDLLACRLLMPTRRDVPVCASSHTAEDARRERLQVERRICAYVQEILPREGESMRHMMQMCDDMAAAVDVQEAFRQYQQHSEESAISGMRLAVQVVSRLAWPRFALLRAVPLPIRRAMDQFTTFYERQHSNRHVVWLCTGHEAVTFTVAFQHGAKTITGSLELCAVFIALGEAGAAGLTWQEIAQRLARDEPSALTREMRQLVTDAFFLEVDSARVRLNANFASRQARYRFRQPLPLRGSGKAAEESHQSHLAGTQVAIMKQMKAAGACRYNELFDLTQRCISQFHLQAVVFKTALEWLIEKEYIERDPMDKQRFIYKA